MKVIISHDVDHLDWTDHFKDLYLAKYLTKHLLFGVTGKITGKMFLGRVASLKNNRQHRLPELIEFDRANGVEPTFFVGLNNGLGLSYNRKKACETIKYLKSTGAEVGVHGIAYHELDGIKAEREWFHGSGFEASGIRMHYLRKTDSTLGLLSEVGYAYDSTRYALENPYEVSARLVEFPVSIMDVYVVNERTRHVDDAKRLSLQLLREAEEKDLKYFTAIFHDHYFNPEVYPAHYQWYTWLVSYLRERKYEFTTFEKGMKEMSIEKS